MEAQTEKAENNKVVRTAKPSKTGVLTSIRTLRKNLKELGWKEGDLEKLEKEIKEQIIKEL